MMPPEVEVASTQGGFMPASLPEALPLTYLGDFTLVEPQFWSLNAIYHIYQTNMKGLIQGIRSEFSAYYCSYFAVT